MTYGFSQLQPGVGSVEIPQYFSNLIIRGTDFYFPKINSKNLLISPIWLVIGKGKSYHFAFFKKTGALFVRAYFGVRTLHFLRVRELSARE
jgi:hypothetical protein